jgi:hypothetical protein
MIRIALVVLAGLLVLVAVYLGRNGRHSEDQGAVGAAWTLVAFAIMTAVYALVRLPGL